MGDGTGVVAVSVDDDTVSTGRAAGVNAASAKRELLVRAADGEVETLVVVVGVRVGGAASSVAGLVVGAGSVGGGADLGRGVGGGAAGGGGLADLERLGLRPLDGAGNGKAQEGSQGSEGLDDKHCGGFGLDERGRMKVNWLVG